MTRKISFLTALLSLTVPVTAMAYIEPENVLLNRDLFLPPSARDAQDRTLTQNEEAAARREREQQRAFELQNPTPEPVIEEEPLFGSAPADPTTAGGYIYAYPVPMNGGGFPQQLFGAAPSTGLDNANLELARTMRLLSRVNQNQATSQLTSVLHSSADDLAPTGAGSVAAATIMVGAVLYTLRRAARSEAVTRAF